VRAGAEIEAGGAARVRVRLASYAELAKIRISAMVALTTAAGFDLAPGPADVKSCLGTVLGTMMLSSAAGALNQVVEGDLDARMRRTRSRPIPAKRVSEVEASAFALAIAVGGLALLLAFANPLTAALAGGCLLFYVGVYTPLKTRTTWNTLVGAIAGAVPPVLGWTSAAGSIDAPAWALFAILFAWQVPHFFAIALLYRDDYAAAGFRMLPVVDVKGTRTALETVAFTVILGAAAAWPYFLGVAGGVYLGVSLASSLLFLAAALRMVRAKGARAEARRVLWASIAFLPVVLGALVLDKTN
jgi:protoheme IX farnesyltransferase